MKKRDVVFHVFMIVSIVYTISNYQDITLTQLLFHTITTFIYGAGLAMSCANFVIKVMEQGGE